MKHKSCGHCKHSVDKKIKAVVKHVKEDIKSFDREKKEDKALIRKIK